MKHTVGLLLLIVAVAAQAAPGHSRCAPAATADQDIVTTLQAIFAAAKADDLAGFHAVTTTDFYLYENGEKLVGDRIMQLMAQLHAAGKHYDWNITEPAVHADCKTAWVAYVNRGSVEDDAGHQALNWLESANLEFDGTRWRVRFMHSTRAKSG